MRRTAPWIASLLVACSPVPRERESSVEAVAPVPASPLAACPECPEYDDADPERLDDATVMPGPNTLGPRDRARLDAEDECRNCHAELAREHAESAHATAFTDPMFRAAFARERESKFCQGCHAPEAELAALPSERAGAIGVGCVSCHLDLDGRTVLAAPGPEINAPHPLRRSPRFASADACAGCHEFAFPDARADPNLLMQRTISEQQASEHAERPCQSCHMPAGSHRVPVDAALLSAAADISVERDATRLVVTLDPRALGHAFPTGDLFRRLCVAVSSEDGGWTEQKFLARRFDIVELDGRPTKVETADERVGVRPGPTRVTFELPERAAGQPLRWAVDWERVLETPIGASSQAEVWDRERIAGGVLPR